MTYRGEWRTPKFFDTVLEPKALIESRIAQKMSNLPEYRKAASENWLLIVNFLGPGEVYVRADQLAQWEFTFDFDKVFLFLRVPGNNGEVIEVRRA